jgi:hypothetical protein
MIFAELVYQNHYSDLHAELLAFVGAHFSIVQAGLQSDSWIWILDGEEKVAIDTFTSRKHQVKSLSSGTHVRHLIDTLRMRYKLKVLEVPQLEGHEDGSSV